MTGLPRKVIFTLRLFNVSNDKNNQNLNISIRSFLGAVMLLSCDQESNQRSLNRPVARRAGRLLRHLLDQSRQKADNAMNAFSELQQYRSTEGGDQKA